MARALGYSDTKSAIADHVDGEDKQIIKRGQIATFEIPTRGMTIINESGLYILTELTNPNFGGSEFRSPCC